MPPGKMAFYVNLVTPAPLPRSAIFRVLQFSVSKQAGPQALQEPQGRYIL
jgi:hypothetical protein